MPESMAGDHMWISQYHMYLTEILFGGSITSQQDIKHDYSWLPALSVSLHLRVFHSPPSFSYLLFWILHVVYWAYDFVWVCSLLLLLRRVLVSNTSMQTQQVVLQNVVSFFHLKEISINGLLRSYCILNVSLCQSFEFWVSSFCVFCLLPDIIGWTDALYFSKTNGSHLLL